MNNKKISGTKVALYAAIGSSLEYYDFVIYGLMAKYIAMIFFSADDQMVGLIKTFSIFSIGYIARPLGGVLIGHYADLYGRKNAFLFSTLIMAIATFAIGLLPTYQQWGIFAPIMLTICRIVQGASFGAELPGATVITSECGSNTIAGRLCGMIISGTALGSLAATGILAIITRLASTEQIIEQQIWRIPFLLGGSLAIVTYFIRKNIPESPEFVSKPDKTYSINSLCSSLKGHLLHLFTGFSIIFFAATMIIINIYFPIFMSKIYGYKLTDIYHSLTLGLIASFVAVLLCGLISDYISKFKIMLGALIVTILAFWPMHNMLRLGNPALLSLFLILYQLILAFYFTSAMPVVTRIFPTEFRYSGMAIVYNLAFVVASTIPTIAALPLVNHSIMFVLCTFLGAIALSVVGLMIRFRGSLRVE